MKKHFGRLLKCFTLSESLITLALIGVIASMTVPVMIHSYEKQVTLTRLKVAYTMLGNAVKQSEARNGHIKNWVFGTSDTYGKTAAATAFATKYITPYLNVDYTCTYSSNSPKCFYGLKNQFYGVGDFQKWRNCPGLQEIGTYAGARQSYMVRLKNGMSVAISAYNNGKSLSNVRIVVDIDGPHKGKSVTGIDVFEFAIYKNGGFKAYPGEWTNGRLNCSTDPNNGYGNPCSGAQYTGGGQSSCAAYIINNNWKIPDDYPFFK